MARIPLGDEFRERELSALLEKLGAKVLSEEEIKGIANEMEKLYEVNGGYFHASYGVVSGIVTELYKNHETGYIEQVSHNLNNIILFLKDMIGKVSSPKREKCERTYRSLIELQDFVSMESIRVDQVERQIRYAMSKAEDTLNEASTINEDAQQSILKVQQLSEDARMLDKDAQESIQKAKELSENVEKIAKNAKETLNKANKINEDAQNLKTEVISILAIFAAIILAVTGGISVFGGAISSIGSKEISLFQLLLVVDFCVIGLFDGIYLLLYVVSRMAGKDLSVECEHGDCKKCGKKGLCKGLERFAKRAPYVVGFNVFLIIMGVAIVVLHICGVLL